MVSPWAQAHNEPDQHETDPLMSAAIQGDINTVRGLVAQGADVNELKNGVTPLWMAAGATPREDALTLAPTQLDQYLHRLARQTIVLKYLLEHGANPNLYGKNASPPIVIAAANFNLPAVKALLMHGARVDASKNNSTALLQAASRGYEDIVKLLLASHAHIDIRDVSRRTPLTAALGNQHYHLAMILLDAGADPDLVAWDGSPPLLMAIRAQRAELVESLLKHGANADAIAPDGMSVRDHALREGGSDVANLLAEYRR